MNTLFDKIWDKHVVLKVDDGPTQLYIDRLYCHEVTSPQAFDAIRDKGIKVLRPKQIYAMPDHNTPSDQQEVINDPIQSAYIAQSQPCKYTEQKCFLHFCMRAICVHEYLYFIHCKVLTFTFCWLIFLF